MSAEPLLKPDFDEPEDHQLAADIARAMHHRPLMSRLARVDAVHGDPASAIAQSATRLAPAPEVGAETPPPLPVDPRSIEEVIDDLRDAASTPLSSEWLDRARLEKRQEARRHAFAWVTTLAIVGTIVTAAAFFLRT